MTPAEQIREKILKLDSMLKAENPGMEQWLREIHKNLKSDESLVQVLSDEEIGICVSVMSRIAQTVVVKDMVKSTKGAGGKKLNQMTLDDL